MNDRLAELYVRHLETVKKRHDEALEATGFDRVAIYGGAQHMIFLDDNPYPFKVNPHFKSWIPVMDNPNCFLTYAPGSKPTILFYQPVDFWHKPADNPEGHWVEHFDIQMIATPESARQHLQGGGRTAFIGEWDTSFAEWGLENPNPQNLIDYLHYQRAWKTEYEVECMRRANALGARGHKAAEKAFRAGASEYEIHLQYMQACTHAEAELPYGNIVAINEHAAVLHYQHLQRQAPAEENRHSFLIDAGTTYHGYASDITRTYSQREDEFAQLIDAVDGLQQELCDEVKPGLDYRELQSSTHRKVGKVLSDFGFISIDGDEAFERGVTAAFFPHGVGHYIGLQVHDVGGFMADAKGTTIPKPEGQPFLRLTRVVEPGQVFTVEPGIYFIDPLLRDLRGKPEGSTVNWDKVDTFRKFGGVRIEDDLVVTETGHENLTRPHFS